MVAIQNINGWLAISFANDSSLLYMGRLLQGFGVCVISYMVCNKVSSLHDYSVPRMF
uniref:Uncharacterized protein n=1 Tax=Triticum urartu TaxID=4572 RepID=A0A8R7U0S6_TRIUA